MADTVTIDLSGVYSAINNLGNHIDKNLTIVNGNVNNISKQVEENRKETEKELNYLKQQLFEMRKEQKKSAALQRAITEIIRVRQELEQKFGTQKLVRDNMLGILQANDLGLITKTTISQCTEQLMISAPKYWLAPALVALAAWISDNKALAQRAVKEAYKRDEAKTCLLFALITRRVNAGRISEGKEGTNVCFAWLSRYFSLQDPFKMKKSIISYVDSYTSGIFGVDKDNICEDQINEWLNKIISSKPEFEQEQNEYWKNFFAQCSSLQIPNTPEFKALQIVSPQYNDMMNYLKRIKASEDENPNRGIKSYIGKIKEEIVDKEQLVKDIDDQLYYLVTNFEDDEAPLRYEEKYLGYVKEFEGDEELAKKKMALEQEKRRDDPVDFVVRLRDAIVQPDAKPSAKKTALAMMKGYIKNAFNDFIVEYKDKYPTKIDLIIKDSGSVVNGRSFEWTGETENSENKEALVTSLKDVYESERKVALSKIDDETPTKKKKTGGIIAGCLFFLIVPIFVGVSMRKKATKQLEENDRNRKAINAYYDSKESESVSLLTNALVARNKGNELVESFKNDEKSETIDL